MLTAGLASALFLFTKSLVQLPFGHYVDHQPGKGKFKGLLGALVVQLPDGTEFSVGTGFSDAERAAPPPAGSVITFRYQELSDGGVPRFPSFVRVSKLAAGGPAPGEQPAKARGGVPAGICAAAAGGASAARRFEFVEGKSSKFWEVSVDGCEMTVRYGRIGTAGTSKVKSFADAAAARREADKLIAEKTGKGYVET